MADLFGNESRFKDLEYLTAKEKETVYKHWIRFLEEGLQKKHFTKQLYKHLRLHCGVHAHYDINGCYGYYFEQPQNTMSFIDGFISYTSDMFRCKDYDDINDAMRNALVKHTDLIKKVKARELLENDLKLIAGLFHRHGIRECHLTYPESY